MLLRKRAALGSWAVLQETNADLSRYSMMSMNPDLLTHPTALHSICLAILQYLYKFRIILCIMRRFIIKTISSSRYYDQQR
jgi:hypothetical protein